MTRLLGLGVLVALVFVATGSASPHTSKTTYCGEQRAFGYIRSLTKTSAGYRMRFDPAFFLTGATANQAAAQDGVIPPGQPVPNDNYVVNETKRTYLYTVTAATKIRVLLKGGNITEGNPVTAATLAQLVAGKQPVKLFEGLDTGFWMGVHIDRACSLTQQYHP